MPTLRLLPELEDSLRQIPGVRAASVVTDHDRFPTEVHVLAAPGRSATQVVRDVQSLALAKHDVEIDHRIVSVVQIGEPEAEPLPEEPASSAEAGSARPRIASIMVRTSGQKAEASVTLAAADLLFEGKATRPVGAAHRPRLVAAATLDALAELLGQTCDIESATLIDSGGREVALTVLTLAVPRLGEQVLTGTAVVRGDDAEAVCKSVLSALNRQLTAT